MNTTKKYFLYARKSTESDERQIQSLDDQIRIMTGKAKSLGIEITDQFIESKSAKIPENRPRFSEMIERIEAGEAKGIVAWKFDRISRNPVDSGTIQFMLQRGALNEIITNDREYTQEDSGLLMSVESGMANQYILDLVKNVNRGQISKCLKGMRPTLVPIGYLNEKAEKIIITDQERFDLVRRMWDLMLTGTYSIRKVIDTANEEWGLRTVKKKKSGGGPLARSSGERIFRNIFYTGYFYHNGELIKGAHEAMISLEEYDRVQRLLGKKGKPSPKHREFSYTGMITCGICGCMVTAETKNKYIKSTAETKEYTSYHCTKKKKEAKCTEKSISVEKLEDQIIKVLESIEIDMEFQQWVFEAIKENFHSEFETRQKAYQSILSSIESEKNRRKKLTDMYLDELIGKDEFERKKSDILRTIAKLEEKRDATDLTGNRNMETTEKVFELALGITQSFNSGDIQRKKDVFHALGKNFILKDGLLTIELEPWFQVIQKEYPKLAREFRGLEPTKKDTSTELLSVSDSKMFKWWVIRGSNPGPSP